VKGEAVTGSNPMNNTREYFGTDGIRGVASIPPLDPETLVRLGRAIAKVFLSRGKKQRILIGKDTRLSGYMIETSLAAGITAMGADVLLVGPLPTAGVAYLTWSMRASAGIMISASHNPYQDNGIKIFGADGYKLPDQVEQEIEGLLKPGGLDGKGAAPGELGKAARVNDAIGRYTVFLKNYFPRELTLNGVRIGLDCANGAAYVVAPQAFTELGAEIVARGVSPNGRNINAGFGSLYPEVVRKLVIEQNLDIGVALDGDGDRAIFVDEKGNVLDGDMILGILAEDWKNRELLRKPKVVATVMSNLGLDQRLRSMGIGVERVQVGDRYVLERMLKEGYQLGGEQSGHIILGDLATSGDGILTALMVLAVMQRRNLTLSQLNTAFVRFPQKLINVNVRSKPPLDSVPAVQKALSQKESELGESGRVVLRYSGTENKVRIMVECMDEETCEKHARDLAEVIEKELGGI